MAVTDTLNSIKAHIEEAYVSLEEKNANIPDNKNIENLSDSILSIEGGGGGAKYAPRRISFYQYAGTELDYELENLDFTKITNASSMFNGCTSLKSLPTSVTLMDLKSCTDVSSMIYSCSSSSFTDLSHLTIKMPLVRSASFFIYSCPWLLKTPTLDFENNTVLNYAPYMFGNNNNLEQITIKNWDTSNMTSFENMFYYAGRNKASVAKINLENCNINSSNVTTFYRMFTESGFKITDLGELDSSNVTNMSWMFRDYKAKITTLQEFNAEKVINLEYFCNTSCDFNKNLVNWTGLKNLGQAYLTTASANYNYYTLDLRYFTVLSHDSLVAIINNLYDIKSKGCNNQKLILSSTSISRLSASEREVATNKGWTISTS